VQQALQDVSSACSALKEHLTDLNARVSKKSAGSIVVSAFFKGSDEEKKLEKVMSDLATVKMNLVSRILLANVGLTQGVNNEIKANTQTISHLSRLIKEKLGPDSDLRIARVVEGKPQTGTHT
jgi:hypothetical protein